ncbi:MAG TPA: DNA-3-methyladenine glycosylase 2 family protein [Hanamia sp.]|nr:DNA-3-methyladenine glycosylase 2 family protein [Hanamia sp.]
MMSRIVNKEDIQILIKKDITFADIHCIYGAPPNWYRQPGFITLSKIILEQQVSLASANAHFLKLKSYLKEFTPCEILKLTNDEMRTCQISRQKSKYLRDLSTAILDRNIELEKLHELSEIEIRNKLTGIKGIGNWTTDIYLMFVLQAKDIFPAGDVAVINTIKELTSAKTKEEIIFLSEKWKPLRSLATYFLWHYYLEKRKRKNK